MERRVFFPSLFLFLFSCCFPFIDTDNVGKVENLENIEDEDMKAAFELWKSKSYALTVPMRIVALEGSLPPIWIRVRFVSFFLQIWLDAFGLVICKIYLDFIFVKKIDVNIKIRWSNKNRK